MESVFQHTEQHEQRLQACKGNGKMFRLSEDATEVVRHKGWREFAPDHVQLQCQGGWALFFRSHQGF